ncbi:MAG: AAA family ATPase [Gammaproteobacteria bacterium]|nr:AAA family ATPase [Gammaproteobacteria bacterium]
MSVAPDLQNTYFLTRQSANVMEDLYRQMNQSGVVCLLYGSRGVGKSRLLQQFVSSRLVQDKVIFVEFDANGNFHAVATPKQQWKVEQFVQKLLQPSEPDSIFLIDQIEHAPPDIIAAIFHYWQLEARLKDQKLILTSNPDKLKQLLDLSQKSSISINSLELKPLSANEQIEFIRSRCCAGHAEQPILNRQQKSQLKQSQGLFSQLVLLQKQWSGQIECREKHQQRSPALPAILGIVLVAAGLLLWTLLRDEPAAVISQAAPTPADTARVADPAVTNVTTAKAELPATGEQQSSAEETVDASQDQPTAAAQPEQVEPVTEQAAIEQEAEIISDDSETVADETIDQPVNDMPTEALPEDSVIAAAPTDPVAEPEANDKPLADRAEPEPATQVEAEPEPKLSLYQQRLQASEQWLAQSVDSTSSIQLMLLGFEIDAEQAIEQYLQGLLAKDIDTANIMLYSTVKNQRQVIGVLYGVYPDRRQARQNIRLLPRALNANKPIIRTVKGIKDEISNDRLQR